MQKLASLVLGAFLVFSTNVIAQDGSDICNKFTEHGLRNISIKTDQRTLLDKVYSEYCSSDFENFDSERASSFGITIQNIPFNFSNSSSSASAKHNEFCSVYKRNLNATSQEIEYANILFSRAIDAWEKCVELAKKDLFVDIIVPQSQKFLDISLRYTGPASGGIDFNGIETSGFSCTSEGMPIDASTSFKFGQAARQIRCERQSEELQIEGNAAHYYPDGGVTVKAGQGVVPVEFVEMIDGPAMNKFDKISNRIAMMQGQLEGLKSNLQNGSPSTQIEAGLAYDSAVQNAASFGGVLPKIGESVCASGYYAVGVRMFSTRHKQCSGCTIGFQVVCEKLNAQ